MSKDVGDVIGTALGRVTREAVQTMSADRRKGSSGVLSGGKGLAAGAGLVVLAPLAAKGAQLASRGLSGGVEPVKRAGEKLSDGVKDVVGDTVDEAGGAAKLAKDAGKSLVPGGGGKSSGQPGVGKGRRMPIQQAVDVAVPISTAYNQWTQFEDWPKFMYRLERVTQVDECHVAFKTKIWGISKQFSAEIVEQRPDERIKWRVVDGVGHTGVVTFHELAPRLTRIEANIDVHPGSLIEKAARGMRHVKRAVRADLARFKAYVEMEEEETGAWRGEISDGKVKSSASGSSSGGKRSSSRSRATSRSSSSKASGGSSSRTRSSGRSASSKASGGSSSSRKSSGSASGGSPSGRKSSRSGGGRSSNGSGSSGGSSRGSKSSSRASSNGSGDSRSSSKKTGASSS